MVGADREVQWAVVLPHCLVVPGERPGRAAPAPGHPPGNCLIYSEIFHCPRHVILTTQRGLNSLFLILSLFSGKTKAKVEGVKPKDNL